MTMLAVGKKFGKGLPEQTAINGQVLRQSGMLGCSGGQHGMSPVIAAVISAGITPAAAGLANGARMMPTIARTGSSMRSVRQIFTGPFSHNSRGDAKRLVAAVFAGPPSWPLH